MRIIGFVGKGGTGKTTLTALFLRELLRRKKGNLLVVDSDPNECLASLLGSGEMPRVSDMLKSYKLQRDRSPELTGLDIFKGLFDTLLMEGERDGYDMIVMGRGEGEGCYCAVNDLLKAVFNKTAESGQYEYLLMDCEAGLEHISRKTSGDIDDAIILTDASKTSLDTLGRIKEVALEVGLGIDNYYVVANRTRPEMVDKIKERAESLGFKYVGAIPEDVDLSEMAYQGKTVFDLPEDSPAARAIIDIVDKIAR
jgi:CO dehydrogenase maturation factor